MPIACIIASSSILEPGICIVAVISFALLPAPKVKSKPVSLVSSNQNLQRPFAIPFQTHLPYRQILLRVFLQRFAFFCPCWSTQKLKTCEPRHYFPTRRPHGYHFLYRGIKKYSSPSVRNRTAAV